MATRQPIGPRRCCGPSFPHVAGRPPNGPSVGRCTGWDGDGSGPSSCSVAPTRPMQRKKAVAQQAAAMVAAGGEVWFGDETTLREFPPLRAAWAKREQQQIVVISGRNARRVVHGALNVATGEFTSLIRERSRQDDCAAFVETLGQLRPHVPKLLVWDNAPPHHPKRVRA